MEGGCGVGKLSFAAVDQWEWWLLFLIRLSSGTLRGDLWRGQGPDRDVDKRAKRDKAVEEKIPNKTFTKPENWECGLGEDGTQVW